MTVNRAAFDPRVSPFAVFPLGAPQDPDVVTFVAPCPVSADHPAQWTERRDDCRTVAEYWCPVCEVGVAVDGNAASAAPEGPSERSGGVSGPPVGARVYLGAQSVSGEDAA